MRRCFSPPFLCRADPVDRADSNMPSCLPVISFGKQGGYRRQDHTRYSKSARPVCSPPRKAHQGEGRASFHSWHGSVTNLQQGFPNLDRNVANLGRQRRSASCSMLIKTFLRANPDSGPLFRAPGCGQPERRFHPPHSVTLASVSFNLPWSTPPNTSWFRPLTSHGTAWNMHRSDI